MCWDITSLMICVDWKISSNTFFHLELIESHHVWKVSSPIERMVRFNQKSIMVFVSVDSGYNLRKFGQKIHRVIIVKLPIFGFVDSLRIGFEEFTVTLDVKDSQGKHSHRVIVFGQVCYKFDLLLWKYFYITFFFWCFPIFFISIIHFEPGMIKNLLNWKSVIWILL